MKSKLEVRGTAVGGGDNSFKAFFVRHVLFQPISVYNECQLSIHVVLFGWVLYVFNLNCLHPASCFIYHVVSVF